MATQLELVWHAYHSGSLIQLVDYEKRLEEIKHGIKVVVL